jgi:hypothetical protein
MVCEEPRGPLTAHRLLISRRLLTDAVSSVVHSSSSLFASEARQQHLVCAAGKEVRAALAIPGACALLVTFDDPNALHVVEEVEYDSELEELVRLAGEQRLSVSKITSAGDMVVSRFTGDGESLSPVMVPGDRVLISLKCVRETSVTIIVSSLPGAWLAVRVVVGGLWL